MHFSSWVGIFLKSVNINLIFENYFVNGRIDNDPIVGAELQSSLMSVISLVRFV